MSNSKPAYVKPVPMLVASTKDRVQEQIQGRLLFVCSDQLKSGSEKTIAAMVDKDKKLPLKSVLVFEAWGPIDQDHMRKALKKLEGKVVSITNAKIHPKGKTTVFFDSTVKCSWDTKTKVTECENDDAFPKSLPTLPNLKAAASISQAAMISIVAAVTDEGSSKEVNVGPNKTKPVANLKVATCDTVMAAAFWESASEIMSSAKVNEVYLLDWIMLKREPGGKFSLTSVSGTQVHREVGDAASAVTDGLANSSDMVNLSTQYGQSYEDKMAKPVSQLDLHLLETIQALQLGSKSAVSVPGCYVWDARGIAPESSSRAWYTGCTQCKKQLEAKGTDMYCPQHGLNKGKRVYGGQLLLADASHKKEFAVWDETLRRVVKTILGHDDIDGDNIMEDLAQAMKGMEVVVRIGIGMKKDGTSVNFDLFDISQQVTSEGCLALYKQLTHDFGDCCPCIVPACCRTVTVNDLGQLTVKTDAVERTVETVKLMVRIDGEPVLKVPEGIDGLEVTLKAECLCCNQQCLLYAAGLPNSVMMYTRMSPDDHIAAFVQTIEDDYKFPIGYHVNFKKGSDVAMERSVFKWQASQIIHSWASASTPSDMDEKEMQVKRTKCIESLMQDAQPSPKRLRLAKTDDGSLFSSQKS